MTSVWIDPLLFAMSCLVGASLLLALWLGFGPRERSFALAGHILLGFVALIAACFAVAARLGNQPLALHGSASAVVALYLLLVVVPSSWFLSCIRRAATMACHRRGRWATILGLLCSCPFLAVGLVWWELEPSGPWPELTADGIYQFENDSPLERNLSSILTTDCGRAVPTLKAATHTPALAAIQKRMLQSGDYQFGVIEMAMERQNCNCHGYVFTDGCYWIGGAEVNTILSDNDYYAVSQVQTGDLAIYRDRAGLVVHSGVVVGKSLQGVIFVESKWGRFGRFIHPADRHDYPETICTFYRSPRPNHLLRGIYSNDPPAHDAHSASYFTQD
jgi:hypothetical protein